jgi:hypothetical protein
MPIPTNRKTNKTILNMKHPAIDPSIIPINPYEIIFRKPSAAIILEIEVYIAPTVEPNHPK